MQSTTPADVDINSGLDYHRALQRLDRDADEAFQKLMQLRSDAQASPVAVEAAKVAYEHANDQRRTLRPGDKAAITKILGDEQ